MQPPTPSLLTMDALFTPAQAGTLAGGSGADRLYTALNQLAALALLVLLAPLMIVVALSIRREDGAPILYGHWRVGQQGRLFRCWKFRTMVRRADAVLADLLERDPAARDEWQRHRKLRDDPRVLRIGRFLRRSSLDELPQLLNVLGGEMHLVGPRPVVVQEVLRYGPSMRHYLSVKPGMTGLWQVSGRNNLTYVERVALDTRYVETRNPAADFGILMRTVRVLVNRDGAC